MPIRPSSPRRSTSEPVVLAIEVVNVNDRHPGAGCTRGTNFPPPGCVELSIPVAKTLAQKLWDAHVVRSVEGEPDLLFVDLHLVHEVTTPQAFEGLRLTGRTVRRPDLTVGTMDHNTPTCPLSEPITDPIAKEQLDALARNCKEFGIRLEDRFSPLQGIVHVIGPELGLSQPGMTIVCGDSHTSTHGAMGALAFGIGT